MKKTQKKLLILTLAELIALSTYSGTMTYHSNAVDTPPPLPAKSTEIDYEFQGDKGKHYILGDFIGGGNQSVVFKCTCKEDGEGYVVKIPINDFDVPDVNHPNSHNFILKVLRESFIPRRSTVQTMSTNPEIAASASASSKKTAVAIAPPPTPMKKVRSKWSANPTISFKPIPFSLSGSPSQRTGDMLIDDEEPLLFSATLKQKRVVAPPCDNAFATRYSGNAPTDENKNRLCSRLDFHNSTINQCSHTHSEALNSTNKLTTYTPRSIPKPDICGMHLDVIDPCAINALRNKEITGIVPIESYRPHIEAFIPTTLKDVITNPLSARTVFEWVDNILDVLIQLNNLGLCHQDIKPDNIFVNQRHVFVGDLGLVCDFNKGASMCIGTPAYMAPEVWYKSSRNPRLCDRADVFSLGITILEMLTDFRATDIDANSANSYFAYRDRNTAIINNIDKYRLRGSGDPIPDNWKCFLRFCLAPRPEDRPTAKQAKVLLKELVW